MCGIACIIDNSNNYNVDDFTCFTDVVAHRGPDGYGVDFFAGNGDLSPEKTDNFKVALGHRRLSILDLSEAGSQPMYSSDKSCVISFNGEVYNYIELREELIKNGFEFKSECDTEMILAAYQYWGKECVERFNGMWAFVILDRRKRRLFISRDRIGIKPLYYYSNDKSTFFCSEIKQIFTLPDQHPKPADKACVTYLASGHENPPATFYQNISIFPAGHLAEINIDAPVIEPEKFWHPHEIKPVARPIDELIKSIRSGFIDSVKLRLRSDVPVGGCLSGGLDSSSIFVRMHELAPDQTFSAFSSCFENSPVDERPYMQEIINATGSKHQQVFPDAKGFLDDFDKFLHFHDEPMGSVSVYAQYKVMEAARREKVPVLLDGQGGDELFTGYWVAYMLMLNNYKKNSQWGRIAAHLLGAFLPGGNCGLLTNIFSHYKQYRQRVTRTLPFTIRNEYLKDEVLPKWHLEAQKLSPEEYRIAEIMNVYLPRYLKWEDHNSMAHSIESRVPFLDVNLIELVLSIPPEMNLKSGWNKYLFRLSMEDKLPSKICWRKDKKGFETPQEQWMKHGVFHDCLKQWSLQKEHPVSEYLSTDFSDINKTLQSGEFDAIAMFRLFCLDKWLSLM